MILCLFAVFVIVVQGSILPQDQGQEVNVTGLQETILGLQASLEELKAATRTMKQEMKLQAIQIETKMAEQDNNTNLLNAKVSHNVDVLRGMGSKSLDVGSQNTIRISQITERVSSLERREREKVAFSAYLTVPGNHVRPTNDTPVTIPFNQIFTNIGGHFSSTNHAFRCPVRGYYHFEYNIYSGRLKREAGSYRSIATGVLVKDVTVLNSAGCGTHTSEKIYCHASNSIVVLCDRNSHVYVVAWGANAQIHDGKYTTFSGFLIKSL